MLGHLARGGRLGRRDGRHARGDLHVHDRFGGVPVDHDDYDDPTED
jgi:hypothetical protein